VPKKRKRRANGAPPGYRAAHWGIAPTGSRVRDVPNPKDNGKLIELGVVHSLVYVTRKGTDREDVEYEHEFSFRDPPTLCYGDRDGKLYLVGGEYKMTVHGIIK
jgi:hypothetical protein